MKYMICQNMDQEVQYNVDIDPFTHIYLWEINKKRLEIASFIVSVMACPISTWIKSYNT